MSNSPLDGVYNPVVFYECRNTITYLNQWNDRQVPFRQKKKRVFGRYGFTGLQGTNITNWIYNHKIQFALASMLYSNILDIK